MPKQWSGLFAKNNQGEDLGIGRLKIDEKTASRRAPARDAPATARNAPERKPAAPAVKRYAAPKPRLQPSGARGTSRALTSSNWWTPDDREPQGFAAADDPKPEYQGLSKAKASIMEREDCVVGTIFRAAVHEQDYMVAAGGPLGPIEDSKTCVTHAGAVYSKVRWMIVVAVYEQHYLALPLYTHNGNGLENRSMNAKLEYASVRDSRWSEMDFVNLSQRNQVLDAKMYPNASVLSHMTVAHLTAPIQRRFGMYVELVGTLTQFSANYMAQTWKAKMNAG